MNKKLIPVILAGAILLTACNEEKTAPVSGSTASTPVAAIAKEDAVAIVNGQYISKASLAALEGEISQRNRGQSLPQKQLIEELVQRELLIQDAQQKKLDQTAEFAERMATIKHSLLSQASIQNYLKSNPITDAILKVEYDKNVAASGSEYKARHILLKTEDEAKAIIVELSKGADFAELAKTKSTGPSGPQGGDLGWFAAGQMVAPFSEAVIALENNKFTTEAVQTQFGWHVILREGSREQTPPPFESIKEQIRPQLQRQKMQEFLDSLRQKAKIEVLLAPVTAKPAAAVEATVPSTDKAAEPASEDVKAETTEKTAQAKDAVSEVVEQVVEKATDTAEAVKEDATKAVADTVEKTNEAVSESATKALDALAK